jgi:hypothetical protein
LRLRFYDGSTWSTAATTATDSDGRYRFTEVASLGDGQEYYVRFGPNNANPAYLSGWWAPGLTAFTSGTVMPGGDFDIANFNLLSPANGAMLSLPVTFTWQQRNLATDTYRIELFDPDTGDGWITNDLGNVGSAILTGMPQDAVFGKSYGWDVLVYNGPDSYGATYYYRTITFLSGMARSPITLLKQPMREGLREHKIPVREP